MEKKEASAGVFLPQSLDSIFDLEELMKEVQEARRIKMLHQASKAMDMEHELRALRIQLAEKSKHSLLLQKERTNDRTRLVIATNSGIVFRVFIGVSFPSVSLNKIHLLSSLRSTFDVSISNDQDLKKLKGKNDYDDNGRNDRSGSIG